MNLHLYLFCFVTLITLAGIRPSSAHPTPNTRPLKREKRICSEVSFSSESVREWKHAPNSLELTVEGKFPVHQNWSHFVQVFVGKGSWEREKEVGGTAEVCEGRVEGGQRNDVILVRKNAGSPTPQPHYILFSSSLLSLSHTLTVWFSCPSTPPQCFHLLLEGSASRVRRNVQYAHSSAPPHSSHASDGEDVKWGVWVGVGIVGLVGVLAALAMCAHSAKAYNPDMPNSRSSEVADTSERIATKSDSQVDLLNSDSMSKEQSVREQASEAKSVTVSTADSNEDKQLSSQQSGSQEPLIQSKDPSPNLPTLETVDNSQKVTDDNAVKQKENGEEAGYASVTKPHTEQKDGYAYVDTTGEPNQNEDEAGYAYATVGGARGEGPVDRPGEGNKEKGSALPSYGKVTRHMVPVSNRGSYSEVRPTSSPMLPPGRPRAVTEPMDPVNDHRSRPRDDRALTESAAHLPLPQIPQFEVRTEMFGDKPGGASVAQPEDAPPMRESVYESVEDANDPKKEEGIEDMYESVSEDLRQTATPTSPTLSPSSPAPPPPRSPSGSFKVIDTPPPPSPKSTKMKKVKDEEDGKKKSKEHAKSEQKKHKALSKTKSDSATDSRGRSLSSLFSRRKGTVGGDHSASPKLKKEKDQHEPLPQVPTGTMSSPTHLLPPSPPHIPPPLPPSEEFEDDPPDSAYDMIDDINPRRAALLRASNASAKEKSASLPSSMRTASAGILQPFDHGPLPDVPEESAGGVVARERVKEDMDPEYDTVVLGQVMDEPNYDSVEFPNVENASEDHARPKLEPAELGGPEDVNPEKGLTPTKYAKVTSHLAVENPTTPDHRAHSPDHDDLGYAVIPAHLKMRKRAMSDALKKREQVVAKNRSMSLDDPIVNDSDELDTQEYPMEPEYESVTDEMRENAVPAAGEETETPYASVDMAAKRRSQLLRQQDAGGAYASDSEPVQSFSPNPPPLPDQGDLGDLSEFQQPPIPIQLEESLKLIDSNDPPYSRIMPPPGQAGIVNPYSHIDVLPDPPYASVKQKIENEDDKNDSKQEAEEENPYATVDNVSGELEAAVNPNDPPYAKIEKGKVVGDEEEDDNPGYENTGSNLPAEDAVDSSITNGEHNDMGQSEEDTYDRLDYEQREEDAYDRLDHGFGNAAACQAMNATSPSHVGTECSTAVSPNGDTEYSTIKLDFDNSVSPELVVTPADNPSSVVNGNDVSIDTEEKVIDFTN